MCLAETRCMQLQKISFLNKPDPDLSEPVVSHKVLLAGKRCHSETKEYLQKALEITGTCRFFAILKTCSSDVFDRFCLTKVLHSVLCSHDIHFCAGTRSCQAISRPAFYLIFAPTLLLCRGAILTETLWLNWHPPQLIIILSLGLSGSQFISYLFMSL